MNEHHYSDVCDGEDPTAVAGRVLTGVIHIAPPVSALPDATVASHQRNKTNMHTNTTTERAGRKPVRHHTTAYLRARTPKDCQAYRKARR